MAKIHRLPQTVIELIAAGEVAERPAVIVKELLENSLDAGATDISVDIFGGGLDKIVVHDNGLGMSPADLELSYQRHTTSKIYSIEDLSNLTTLGFRGEALASIAQISNLTLQSRPPTQSAGFKVQIIDGQSIRPIPLGMPKGTTVIVEHLFRSLPARKKFLKAKTSELRLITETVILSALAHPQVSFKLRHEQQTIVWLPSESDAINRYVYLLGIKKATQLLPVKHSGAELQIQGYVGNLQVARKTSSKQFLFINQRPIKHSAINQLVRNIYGTLLEPRLQPIFILQLWLPPELLDVNIHPRKENVSFVDENLVLDELGKALKKTLAEYDLRYELNQSGAVTEKPGSASQVFYDSTTFTIAKQVLSDSQISWQPGEIDTQAEIMQLHRTYLILQTKQGTILVDQHAAHERILYEQFAAALDGQKLYQKTLKKPLVISLSPSDSLLLKQSLVSFQELGFTVEEFGQDTYKVSTIPAIFDSNKIQNIIQQVLDDIDNQRVLVSVQHKILAYLACRSAVKAGDFLTLAQRQSLIEKLMSTPNRYTCPHGRPTMIKITLSELERFFKRRK